MKRTIIATLAVLALGGCFKDPEQSTQIRDFKVERLFTHEGCTVYRFYDGGISRYFTRCTGAMHSETSGVPRSGKSSIHDSNRTTYDEQ